MIDTSTPRARAREQTMRDIVRIGRVHLATDGAAALSLRAVARDLGIVSSAVYRYVASRDELLTLLVVDGYDELGDAVDAALASVDPADFAGRMTAIGRAVRAWGLAEPATYALLFGSPVPGYEAPAEQTTGPGVRVVGRLVEVWEDAWQAGAIAVAVDEGPLKPRRLARDLARIRREMGLTVPDALMARGFFAWAALFGCVTWEVFGQYGSATFADPADLFEQHLAALVESVGLAQPSVAVLVPGRCGDVEGPDDAELVAQLAGEG
ncbi:regulatory protein, tetR family [Nocardioides exalbidus]|uniref:Regulatory protein, tetR family n=1 Tax=Nocardioides exalbidus TaxID=402596 RepID=A0A1H4TUX5_9ACTN|nr:TetR/AcrR family transcriptional regulator [Nocardioides exalbidus]SEC60303.1 regulatory protein, tetR family [Nocardioides exalbidus]